MSLIVLTCHRNINENRESGKTDNGLARNSYQIRVILTCTVDKHTVKTLVKSFRVVLNSELFGMVYF